MTPSRLASRIAMSSRPVGSTQTGQPGPCTISMFDGSRSSMP